MERHIVLARDGGTKFIAERVARCPDPDRGCYIRQNLQTRRDNPIESVAEPASAPFRTIGPQTVGVEIEMPVANQQAIRRDPVCDSLGSFREGRAITE